MAMPQDPRPEVTQILGAWALIPDEDSETRWDLTISQGKIRNIEKHKPLPSRSPTLNAKGVIDARGKFLAPSLCHPHVHLDKCFLLSDPKYKDLKIKHGTFDEAMELTAKAKARFEQDDLLRRGRWLITESIDAGVTHIRAFVEVDTIVKFKCLDAGLTLKREFQDICYVQICVFAQEPVFSGKGAQENRALIEEALGREGVEVLGTTPYVEEAGQDSRDTANIMWAIRMASRYEKHLDFHLDYHLVSERPSQVFDVINAIDHHTYPGLKDKTVMLGHCTRFTLMTGKDLSELAKATRDLSISLVGLPTSDLYLMDRINSEDDTVSLSRRTGTLPVLTMRKRYKMNATLGINNVGNAFTPQGSCDPMHLASMGVGLYQDGTETGVRELYNAISQGAKAAVGLGEAGGEVFEHALEKGSPADLMLLGQSDNDGKETRMHKTMQDIVNDPPYQRLTIFGGRLVGSRP